MAKRILTIALTLMLAFAAIAKTTYIPTFYTQINITSGTIESVDSTITRELAMDAADGRYSLAVIHDSVS